MTSLNNAMIIGRLGKNPEIKQTNSGTMVLNLAIATSEKTKEKEHTEWHNVVVFGKSAENCAKYLSKGSLVFVEGKLRTRMWEKDGHKNYTTEIIAQNVQFLSSKKEAKEEQPISDSNVFEDIPF